MANPCLKYVIVQRDGREHVLLFSPEIQHSTIIPPGCIPVSAGFIIISKSATAVLGAIGSESLNLKPRPEDKAILNDFLASKH